MVDSLQIFLKCDYCRLKLIATHASLHIDGIQHFSVDIQFHSQLLRSYNQSKDNTWHFWA